MPKGFIDGATITSALTYLNLGRNADRPLWHQISVLETTYLLLQNNIHVIPRPQGTGGERGDYAIAASEFSDLMVDSEQRRQVFRATVGSAPEYEALIKAAWDQSQGDDDFTAWAELQRRDRWQNQTLVYGGLFDEDFETIISRASGYDLQDVKRVRKESADPKIVRRWAKTLTSSEAAAIANAGWVIGGFMRGMFYENLAAVEGLQLLTHPFRKAASPLLTISDQHDVTSSAQALVKILIANALTERTKSLRVHTWATTVKKARDYLQQERLELPNKPHPRAVEIATQVARAIGLRGGPRELHWLIDIGLGVGGPGFLTVLTGFTLAPWILSPVFFMYKRLTNKSVGEAIGNKFLQSNYQFRWLENSIPGRIERTVGSRE